MRILYLRNSPTDTSTESIESLAEALISLSPKLSFIKTEHGGEEIFLDLAPTRTFFGSEERQLQAAVSLVESFDLSLEGALVDRSEWGRALRKGPFWHLTPPGESLHRLEALPVEALLDVGDPVQIEKDGRDREALVAFMRRVGIGTVGDFSRLDTAAVGRRFGKAGTILQEWALGRREWLPPLFTPTEALEESLATDEIISLDALLFVLRGLLVRLEARLVGRCRLARQLRLSFRFDGHPPRHDSFTLSEPLQEAGALLKLLREFLTSVSWSSPLQHLTVAVTDTIAAAPGQLSLFDRLENRKSDLGQYVSRMRASFGDEAVGFAELRESYLPERSWRNVWPPSPKSPPLRPRLGERPLFLFTPSRPHPEPRNWKLTPSENLAVEWWMERDERSGSGQRRYFIAESPRGDRLWLYLDCQSREWFLQGTFD